MARTSSLAALATCYRHPGVETRVSCSRCGRPICPDCMTPSPVGMRCPECAADKTRVTQGVPSGSVGGLGAAPATVVLIALSVLGFLAEIATGAGGMNSSGSSLMTDLGLVGAGVHDGQYYRLVTGGFLHAGLMHLVFNMIALWFIGQALEPSIGTLRFVMIYMASLLAGSFGAIALTEPYVVTVGASGAVFGIFGALFVIAQGRGLSHIARQVGLILGINLLITFSIPGISIGGHLGGLVAGAICGLLVIAGERGQLGSSAKAIEYGGMILVAVVSVAAAIAVAKPAFALVYGFIAALPV